jgi:hypothetical protein
MEIIPYLTDTVVNNLWNRFLLSVQPQTPKHSVLQLEIIDCSSTGIIRVSPDQYHTNPVDSKQIIIITSWMFCDVPQMCFRLSNYTGFGLYPPHNEWFRCEFIETEVRVARWMIKTANQTSQPVNENVEVTLEAGMDTTFTVIDRVSSKYRGMSP